MPSTLYIHHYLDAVMDTVACGVILTDDEMKIRRINRTAQVILDIDEADARGLPCGRVFRPVEGEKMPLLEAVRQNRDQIERTMKVHGPDGVVVDVHVTARLLRTADGQLIGGVQTFGDLSIVHNLRHKLDREHAYQGIISRNPAMRQLFDIMPRMAESASTVLVRGESGTGKELFARGLHQLSPRGEKPFVAVNCAALPDTLLEAELFGHVKGAFTDARSDRAGRIATAEGGTLFLDEVGDISLPMQVKLLRFLQERQYNPLGSDEVKRADVRVIAATNRDLDTLLRRGELREDFYYRLNVLSLEIPPLRERLEDVPLLVDHVLQDWALLNNRPPLRVTPLAMRALMSYSYPGNVRELENIIERAAVLAEAGIIDLDSLPMEIRSRPKDADREGDAIVPSSRFSPLELAEREAIREALDALDGHRGQVADRLGLSRTTLWRRMRKYMLA